MSIIADTPLPVLTNKEPQTHDSAKVSPDYVRLSQASAMALRFSSGRFSRDFEFGGINLLLNYAEGCFSDCGYCGLARTRPGNYADKSFIRVEWPLLETDAVVKRMVKYEDKLTRLCISMVTHGRAFEDTVDITERIVRKVRTPLSLLVAPPVLGHEKLLVFKKLGVDIIGIGLDAVSESVFAATRTNVPNGGLRWDNYMDIVNASREIFGPWKVNCHVVVGLGESDAEMVDVLYDLKARQILSFLFSFNPEPDSRMGDHPKSSINRWRRIQLVKYLIEEHDLPRHKITFDDSGAMTKLKALPGQVAAIVDQGTAFMTHGCTSANGEPGCTRPYGSYRPSEAYRDFPFQPDALALAGIRMELNLEEFLAG